MNGPFRNPLMNAVAFIAAAGLFFWLLHEPNKHNKDSDLYIGEWTDPNGEPGNLIRFAYKKIDLPNNPIPVMSAYEGRATLHKHLGQDQATVIFNFESTTPLRLNITVPGQCSFAAIRMVGPDQMRIRFTKTIGEASAADVLEAEGVKAMVRVGEWKPGFE